MMTVLVTGGAGFIGSHTVDYLLQQNMNVIVFDNLSSGKIIHLDLLHPNLEFVQGDILDYRMLAKHVARVDAVLHLAALPSVPKSIEDPVATLKVNTQGFLHVLQAIRDAAKPIRLVYASSASVYGSESTLPCDDAEVQLSYRALSPYALEKANNESYAHLYKHLFGIQSLALRYFNVYGPRQDPESPYSGVISRFLKQMEENEPITVCGDGLQSRDFIHVEDIARANFLSLQNAYAGVLNIATGVPETLLQLISYMEKASSHAANVQFVAPRLGDIRESYANVTQAKLSLDFTYRISLDRGITQLMHHPKMKVVDERRGVE